MRSLSRVEDEGGEGRASENLGPGVQSLKKRFEGGATGPNGKNLEQDPDPSGSLE